MGAPGGVRNGHAEEGAGHLTRPGGGSKTRIRLARYGNDAGVRGAALLAAQERATTLERSA